MDANGNIAPRRAGRPKGAKAKITKEARAICQRLLDRDYWNKKYEELHSGTCNPKLECLILNYAYGMPPRPENEQRGTVIQLGPLSALAPAPINEALGTINGTVLHVRALSKAVPGDSDS